MELERGPAIPPSATLSSNTCMYIIYMTFTHNCGQLLHSILFWQHVSTIIVIFRLHYIFSEINVAH